MKYIIEIQNSLVYPNSVDPNPDIAEFLDTCSSFEQWYASTPSIETSYTRGFGFNTHKFVFSDKVEATKFKILFG